MRRLSLALIALVGLTVSAVAHDYTKGDLTIKHPYTFATMPGAPVAGGYVVIENKGDQADRLIGVKSEIAARVEIHEMAMEGDVMKMREIAGDLEIPANGSVELMPGGYHILFMGLNKEITTSDLIDVTLTFEKAGEVEIVFIVKDRSEKPGMGHGGHGMHKGEGMKKGEGMGHGMHKGEGMGHKKAQ